jgi:saccharopine dehydrogenase-like NADP-dependent oxidoreductase
MRVLVVGAGGVGSSIVSIAARRPVFEQIMVADVDASRAAASAARTGSDRVLSTRVDAGNALELVDLIRSTRTDVVVNACDPRFNPPIFDAAFAAGCHYLDMAMHMSTPHPTHPYELTGVMLGDAQFEVAHQWEERGQLALVGMGVEPGFSDVVTRYASDHLFSRIDEVGVRDGADLVIDGAPFAPTFSIWTTIEECLNPPIVYERDRGWFTTEPFSEPETFVFPEGIGPLGCVNVEHEEVILMPRWLDVGRVTFKYGLGDEFIDVLKTLRLLGLHSTTPLTVRGVEVSRLRFPTPLSSAIACVAAPAPARWSPASAPTVRRAAPTCTKWSTTNGRCANTVTKPWCGRPQCTPWWHWSCWPKGPGAMPA